VSVALGVVLTTAIGLPHVLQLERSSPALAASIWFSGLVLRALAAVFIVLYAVFFLPSTALFQAVTHWCWHTVLPIITTHLPVDGHTLGALATVLPAFVLAGSLTWVAAGLWRAARAVRAVLLRSAVGVGPEASTVIEDGDVVVAAAGLRRPQVIVSAGALRTLDDEELAASLAHERGHIVRRHRWVLVAAELLRALGRFLPGTSRAADELLFHLERDADAFALAGRHDPAALASAICKAAGASAPTAASLALGGGVVVRRVRQLLEAEPVARRSPGERLLTGVAALMASLVLVGIAALPATAHSGLHVAGGADVPPSHCVQ
jgi:Zn-dependent protease with chaperone function